MTARAETAVPSQDETGRDDEPEPRGEQSSLLSWRSGQRTIQRGLAKSRCGESAKVRRIAAAEEGSVSGTWRRRLRGEIQT